MRHEGRPGLRARFNFGGDEPADGKAEHNGCNPEPEIVENERLDGERHPAAVGCRMVQPEEGTVEGREASDVVEIEDSPADDYEHDAVDVAKEAGDSPPQDGVFLEHDDEPEIETPDDEIPACAVPHTGQKPNRKDVDYLTFAVSAHRDVDVIAEEGAEADVPFAPEIRHGGGGIGVAEVFREVESYGAAQTDGHVGITGEVEIDLQREGYDPYPCLPGGEIVEAAADEGRGDLAEDVGEYNLFPKADEEAVCALRDVGNGCMAAVDFLSHGVIPHDGACYELREHGDVEQQVEEVALRGRLAPVYVDKIRDRLEYVEADADGERYLRHRYGYPYGNKRRGEEPEIFKGGEDSQVGGHADYQPYFARVLGGGVADEDAGDEVDHHGEEHERDVDRFAPGVEEEREDDQRDVSE